MSLREILAITSICLGVAGHGQTGPNEPIRLNMPEVIRNARPVFLSEIASQVRYIALETTPKYLIGEKTVHVMLCEPWLFVSEHGKPVAMFDLNGKFHRTLGKIGRGPGEYNFDYLFWPEATSQSIYVWNADAGTLMQFGWDGRHIADIRPEFRPGAFIPFGNNRILSWTFQQVKEGNKFYRMIVHNEKGQTLAKVYEPEIKYDFSRGISIMQPSFSRSATGCIYNSWENDSIFRITPDGRILPALALSLGKLKMTQDSKKIGYQEFMRIKDNYVIDFSAVETDTRWLARYSYKGSINFALIDKASGKFERIANPDTTGPGVFNDVDGGPAFWPEYESTGTKSFVRLIQTVDLLSPESKPRSSPIAPKNQDAARKLRELTAKLNENSNPVVMIVTLK